MENKNNDENLEYEKLSENSEVHESNEAYEVDEFNETNELNEGLKKSKIRCLMCNSSEWAILGEIQSYEVYSRENNYESEEENYINTVKIECKHCGLVLEYNTKYFTDKEKRKVVKKISREKNIIF
ncbi:hypothetical protein [Clostridium sp. DJ247]|uniref:hypothetical protein n=1 Tax=Clostridium sp. DJ247 TaxID=2726188 RepID=UPI00162543DD|nr:hypothetical protein [Clostridium sp. DJ247]MBC2579264.1 hypothetical protein [Clostridium sp. DJ247]MBC2579285.1 hypothetical protein [Clostridium sp. DJ247]